MWSVTTACNCNRSCSAGNWITISWLVTGNTVIAGSRKINDSSIINYKFNRIEVSECIIIAILFKIERSVVFMTGNTSDRFRSCVTGRIYHTRSAEMYSI